MTQGILDYLCPGTSTREEVSFTMMTKVIDTEKQEAFELLSHSWGKEKFVWTPGKTRRGSLVTSL